MAKGDAGKYQTMMDSQGAQMNANVNSLQKTNDAAASSATSNASKANQLAFGDYSNLMDQYKSAGSTPMSADARKMYSDLATNGGGGLGFGGDIQDSINKFKSFGDTGGFSKEDIGNIRARDVAPARSIFANAKDNLDRSSGGGSYVPNRAAALDKMARDSSSQIGDLGTNAEASIAQMIQSGKLAGASGEASTALGGANAQNSADSISNSLKLAGIGGMTNIDQANNANRFTGLEGQSNLYRSTPGMASTFGNQALQSGTQGIDLAGLRQAINSGNLTAFLNKNKIPSDFQQGLGNIGSAMGLLPGVGTIVNAFK